MSAQIELAPTIKMRVFCASQSAEFYTPPELIELVREVLGQIELDPASHDMPQEWIKASRFYREEDAGHARLWIANTVWLNPPYGKNASGRSVPAVWAAKMRRDYESGYFGQGLMLVNSAPGYNWYEDLWTRYPVCCLRDRLRFIRPDGSRAKRRAARGQTLVYFGSCPERFRYVFSRIGRVIEP